MTDPVSPPAAPAPPRRRRRTIRGWLGHLLIGFLVLVVGTMGALAIGLAFGPVSLGPLAPVLMGAVSDNVAGYRLTASDALLIWSPKETRLVIRFVDPRLVDNDGVEIAAANDIAVSFSLEALMGGNIAPRSLTIVGPTATFNRLADGTYDIGIRTEGRNAERKVRAANADAGPFIQALLEPPREGEEDTYLNEVTLSEATITFIDEATSSIVKAPRGTLVLKRTAKGLSATLDGQVSLPKGNWRFYGTANYERGSPTIKVEAGLVDAVLDSLTDAGPLFDEFEGAALPLSGKIDMVVSTDGHIVSAEGAINAAAGLFQVRALSNIPIKVKSAVLTASYDRAKDLFQLTHLTADSDRISGDVTGSFHLRRGADGFLTGWHAELAIDQGKLAMPILFDGETAIDHLDLVADNDLIADRLSLEKLDMKSEGSTVAMKGAVTGLLADKPAVKIDGTLDNISVPRLGQLWPKGVADGARDWVTENVSAGRIVSGSVHMNLSAEALDSGLIPNDQARIELNYEGAELAYIDGLPHLTGVKGTALVFGNRFESNIAEGHVGALTMTEGKVTIEDLNRTGEPANINAVITGKASDILKLIDMKPLGYPSRYGLDPASVGGDAVIHLGLVVPTLDSVKVEDIVFDIKVALTHVAMTIASNIHLTDGVADFVVTGGGLTAKGHGKIAGVDGNFEWDENFNPAPGETSTRFSANAVIDEALRRQLGVDPGAYLDGPAAVEVSMTGNGFNPVTASATVGLTDAALHVPELGLDKKAGEPATMTADLERVADGYRANPVKLIGTGVDAELDILLGFDGSLKKITATRLAVGRNDAAFTVDLSGPKAHVTANVKSLDLDTLVDALLNPEQSKIVEAAQMSAGEAPSRPPSIAMEIKAEKVFMRGGAEATGLEFNIDLDKGNLVGLFVYGKMGDGAMLARLWPQADGRRRVILESDNMGRFVQGLSGYAGVGGGYGKFAILLPKVGDPSPAHGTAFMRDFRLNDQPFLIRLLGSLSFSGLGDLADGNGIQFDVLNGDLTLTDDVISLRRLRVVGPSAGIRAEADIDRDASTLQAAGTFTPVFSLNTLLRCVPFLGKILGGDGGILALAFKVEGPLDAPEVSVNAFSALAPGFTRSWFEYDLPPTGAARWVQPPS